MAYEALTAKRNETARRIRELTVQLGHLDAVIGMFSPEYRPRKRGGVARAILDVLREAPGPMTAAEIAEVVGADVKKVGQSLCYQRAKGAVKSERRGKEVVWVVG